MVRLSTVFCNLLSLIKYYLEKIIAGRDRGKEGGRGRGDLTIGPKERFSSSLKNQILE